ESRSRHRTPPVRLVGRKRCVPRSLSPGLTVRHHNPSTRHPRRESCAPRSPNQDPPSTPFLATSSIESGKGGHKAEKGGEYVPCSARGSAAMRRGRLVSLRDRDRRLSRPPTSLLPPRPRL